MESCISVTSFFIIIIFISGVLMDTMETQCWVQEADVSHALVQMDLRVDVTLLPPVTKTTIADRWSATVNRATQVRSANPHS